MKDYITAKERLSNPRRKYIRECFKDAMVSIVATTVFIILLTQSGAV